MLDQKKVDAQQMSLNEQLYKECVKEKVDFEELFTEYSELVLEKPSSFYFFKNNTQTIDYGSFLCCSIHSRCFPELIGIDVAYLTDLFRSVLFNDRS